MQTTAQRIDKEANLRSMRVDIQETRNLRAGSLDARYTPIKLEDRELDEDEIAIEGMTVAADLLVLEGSCKNPPPGVYLTEFVFSPEPSVRVVFKNADTGEPLEYQLVFTEDAGIQTAAAATIDRDFDLTAVQRYTEWCSKWQGTNKRWKICTGKDCSDGIVCIIWKRKVV